MMMQSYKPNGLRIYSGYWNAFECLVEAVCMVHPRPKTSVAEKNAAITTFMEEHSGVLDVESVDECFRRKPKESGLYAIRNAINHGTTDGAPRGSDRADHWEALPTNPSVLRWLSSP